MLLCEIGVVLATIAFFPGSSRRPCPHLLPQLPDLSRMRRSDQPHCLTQPARGRSLGVKAYRRAATMTEGPVRVSSKLRSGMPAVVLRDAVPGSA